MSERYSPTPDERRALEQLAEQVADVQQTLVANHPKLQQPDRGAHQPQLGAGKVLLHVADHLPAELAGLGLFTPTGSTPHIGIGRMSNGLGCPHAETDADFLGLMVAFRTADGRRVDFITINDPGAPTDTPEEFVALLKATADAAAGNAGDGLVNMLASQARLLVGLARHAGTRAPAIARQVIKQTARTQRSSSAYQQYWTGVVRARDVLGKFTFVPVTEVNEHRPASAGEHYLTDDWLQRHAAGPLDFRLYWVPFLNEDRTPLKDLTRGWDEAHRALVGTVSFPAIDPSATETKLIALLATEMGANQGNWIEDDRGAPPSDLPATEYTAARFLAYKVSQRVRQALPEAQYASFFETGTIDPALAAELLRRYHAKRAAGHGVPDVGEIAPT
jgi:catalase